MTAYPQLVELKHAFLLRRSCDLLLMAEIISDGSLSNNVCVALSKSDSVTLRERLVSVWMVEGRSSEFDFCIGA